MIDLQHDLEHDERLDALLLAAHRNEATWRTFQAVELELMRCVSLEQLLEILIAKSRREFACEMVVLSIVEQGHEIRALITETEL